ncbi:MAG: biosynthetic-type acetolactate synthase large subunit [Actinomycetota bacterium]|jgi:acetolactate synthase-1/2/3 large subunit|nr:biosynthetic-type acetolactate synthase large subunit [Actinomycetota bacterium]MDA8166666.1 biosynthetic-type acetolactate synthase large subunit [Actinomycetota bacterium]
MKGSEIIIESLKAAGVDVVFGLPGGMVIPLYDALFDSDMRHILVRHEQGAAHMADGYARATGKTGVCIATSGPGATNLVTGIANAYMDSTPMVAITGQARSDLIGTDAFQEADITGITEPVVKHSYLIKDTKDIPRVFKEAFYIASTGRPGPVLIDIPSDMQLADIDYKPAGRINLPGYKPTLKGNRKQIKAAAQAIAAASKPVFYAGGGVITAGAEKELLALARLMKIPVTTTLMGLGSFPENNDLSLGMLGMHGTGYANYAVTHCDLLIGVGARFDDRVTGKIDTFARHAKKIHIDMDPAEISKNVAIDVPIVGDARDVLAGILQELKKMKREPKKTAAWLEQVIAWKKKHPLHYKDEKGAIMPQFVIEEINRVTKSDAILCTDVGQHQMWSCLFYTHVKPRHFVSSGGLGTMGFGFPASIGAKVGRPEKTVIDVAGDGSFQMNIQELATAVCNDIPVIVCILNNGYLGMVRQWQELFWNKRYSETAISCQPDFAAVAEAYGALGMTITDKNDVGDAIRTAIKAKRPAVLDFRVKAEENVFPMVPAGKSIDEMIGGHKS